MVKGDKTTQTEIFVIRGARQALLGRPTIEALELISSVQSVEKGTMEAKCKFKFPKLFKGLGKLEGDFAISLKPDAKPHAEYTPRRIPLPWMEQVKSELKRMEENGIISPVEGHTKWCASMVVVPKANGKVRICVDLTKLNESVLRENHPQPCVDYTLAQLAGAKIFSKLDANSGFWQISISPESRPLTTFITPFGRFWFNRLPFGVASALEHFQKRMSQVLDQCQGVLCKMDDVLVHGPDQTTHDATTKRSHQATAISGDDKSNGEVYTQSSRENETYERIAEYREPMDMGSRARKIIP